MTDARISPNLPQLCPAAPDLLFPFPAELLEFRQRFMLVQVDHACGPAKRDRQMIQHLKQSRIALSREACDRHAANKPAIERAAEARRVAWLQLATANDRVEVCARRRDVERDFQPARQLPGPLPWGGRGRLTLQQIKHAVRTALRGRTFEADASAGGTGRVRDQRRHQRPIRHRLSATVSFDRLRDHSLRRHRSLRPWGRKHQATRIEHGPINALRCCHMPFYRHIRGQSVGSATACVGEHDNQGRN